jgi:hypothetical protein
MNKILTTLLLTTGLFAQNNALDFDGSNDYVTTGTNISELNITDDITVETWVYISSRTSHRSRGCDGVEEIVRKEKVA